MPSTKNTNMNIYEFSIYDDELYFTETESEDEYEPCEEFMSYEADMADFEAREYDWLVDKDEENETYEEYIIGKNLMDVGELPDVEQDE
jgi:hypothetical protein